jgi:hypothetical protein
MISFHKTVSLALAISFLGSAVLSAGDPDESPFTLIPFMKVFDPTGRENSLWKAENANTGIGFTTYQGITTLSGSDPTLSWCAMYRPIAVNLTQHPILQINVLSVSKQWYLILTGKQFEGGYLRLIESKDTGLFSFDLYKLANLSGPQKFEVKLGISDPEGKPLTKEKMIFDMLAFTARPDAGVSDGGAPSVKKAAKSKAKNDGAFYIFDPSAENGDDWHENAKDGPEEVRFQVRDGVAVVKGAIAGRNWGAVHREVAVNLKRLSTLEVHVLGVSKRWYLILSHPKLPNGFVRLIETDQTGTFRFNIPKETGLEGIQVFDLQLGVSAPENPTVKGEWVSFDLLRFVK